MYIICISYDGRNILFSTIVFRLKVSKNASMGIHYFMICRCFIPSTANLHKTHLNYMTKIWGTQILQDSLHAKICFFLVFVLCLMLHTIWYHVTQWKHNHTWVLKMVLRFNLTTKSYSEESQDIRREFLYQSKQIPEWKCDLL